MADMVKNNFGTGNSAGFLKRNVLIQKDENGFGLTVSGDNPVYVQSVKSGSAADKAGVEVGDKIIKVNGTLVTESNHIEVVSLIKSGSYVALTLLGKDNKQGHTRTRSLTGIIPSLTSLQSQNTTPPSQYSPTSPSPAEGNRNDRIKDVERNLNQEREFNKSILEKYQRAPSPKTQNKLVESKTRIAALEKNLYHLSGSNKNSPLYRTPLQPVEPKDRPPSYNSQDKDRPPSYNSLNDQTRSLDHGFASGSSSYSSIPGLTPSSQQSSLGSSSTPNLGGMTSSKSKMLKMDNSDFHDTIETVEEENVTTDNSMDWMQQQFEAARKSAAMMSEFGCVPSTSVEDIYSMEDDEDFDEGEQLDKHGPFESLDLLNFKEKCAHLAVFLHYLISNSDPTPLFFWVVTDIYSSNEQRNENVKEWKKWAYEIYSVFVAPSAPLKVNIGAETDEKVIEDAINDHNVFETRLRNIFSVARMKLKPELERELGEFRMKRSIGLGAMFGDRQLGDDMDRASELRIVETTLMPHLDALLGEQQTSNDIFTATDKNSAQACAIATLMKAAGLSGKISSGKGTSLERCRSFGEKEKTSMLGFQPSFKKKFQKVVEKSHQFQGVQYSSTTKCKVCSRLIGGVGLQGYQCQLCEFNVHPKECLNNIPDEMRCPGAAKRGTRRPRGASSKTISSFPPPSDFNPNLFVSSLDIEGRSTRVHSMTEVREPDTKAEPETDPEITHDPDSHPGTPTPLEDQTTPQTKPKSNSIGYKKGRQVAQAKNIHRSNSDKSMEIKPGSKPSKPHKPRTPEPGPATRAETQSPQPESEEEKFSDLDPEEPMEALSYTETVEKKIIKNLKTKEIKRQEIIHELLHTEKTHVRNLKILDKVFYRKIKKSETLQDDEIKRIFPNLDELLEIHQSLLAQLKKKADENPVVEDVGQIMLDAFGGDARDDVKEKFATFCKQQNIALAEWRTYRETRKDFAALMTRLEGHSLCRRLQFGAILASTHQRLVKYPLLLTSLNKTQKENKKETGNADYENVAEATECCKHILNYVNDAIKRCEDELRLKELSRKIIDRRRETDENSETEEKTVPFRQFDILQHKLIMEGDLVQKIQRKSIDLHVVLLNDTLVLLTKQDDKYTLKTQNENTNTNQNKGQSPLISMSRAIVRDVATDKKAFYLVNTSDKQLAIYELYAPTNLEKRNWMEEIQKAIEANKTEDSPHDRPTPNIPNSASATTSPTPPTPTTPQELEADEEEEEVKGRGNSETSDGHLSDEDHKTTNGKDESESDDDFERAPNPSQMLSKERHEELDKQLKENESQLMSLIEKRSVILSEKEGDKYYPFNMEPRFGREKFVISAIEQVDQLRDIFGQFSSNVSEDQKDRVSQSITGLQRYLKIILDDIVTSRHNSLTDCLDGEKDADRDSKRSSAKTYSSDMTDSLPRHSPFGDDSSPPPILVSRTSQEQETNGNGVEDVLQDFDDLSSAVSATVEEAAAQLKTTEPSSPTNGSPTKLESSNLITSPFKIQALRKRPSDPTSQDASVSKLTSKLASLTHDDTSDSELT